LLPTLDAPSPPEGLELLAVGVRGKWLLWSCLQELEVLDPRFGGLPLTTLLDRALGQERSLLELRDQAITLWHRTSDDGVVDVEG
jgi:hypothetical protein